MKKRFTILKDTCTTGFQTHAVLDFDKNVDELLHRRKLYNRSGFDKGSIAEIQKIIEWNSSLRVAFGWSFESTTVFENMMAECEMQIHPPFIGDIVEIISDTRCDWLGFAPFNTFDKAYYENFCPEDLITFNNGLIDFQTRIIKFIMVHPMYRAHAIVRDNTYRFNYFKKIRKDPLALSNAFQYYLDAIKMSAGVNTVPRDIIEEMIGCHFLEHPAVFQEMLGFNILKGTIYG